MISQFKWLYANRMVVLHGIGRTLVGLGYEKATSVITKKFCDYSNKWFFEDAAQKRIDANSDVNRLIQFYNRVAALALTNPVGLGAVTCDQFTTP